MSDEDKARIKELEAELDLVRTNYHYDLLKWEARDQKECKHIDYRATLTGAVCNDCGLEHLAKDIATDYCEEVSE